MRVSTPRPGASFESLAVTATTVVQERRMFARERDRYRVACPIEREKSDASSAWTWGWRIQGRQFLVLRQRKTILSLNGGGHDSDMRCRKRWRRCIHKSYCCSLSLGGPSTRSVRIISGPLWCILPVTSLHDLLPTVFSKANIPQHCLPTSRQRT